MNPQRPWYDRFINALPSPPGWLFPVFTLVMLVFLGFALGLFFCTTQHTTDSAAVSQEPELATRVQSLEERLRVVEMQARDVKRLELGLVLLEHQLKQQGLVP